MISGEKGSKIKPISEGKKARGKGGRRHRERSPSPGGERKDPLGKKREKVHEAIGALRSRYNNLVRAATLLNRK